MVRNEITVRRSDTILAEIVQLHNAISQRAYDLFRNGSSSDTLDNWLKAENDLITKPLVSLKNMRARPQRRSISKLREAPTI